MLGIAVGALVLLSGCTAVSAGKDSSSPEPTGDASSAVPMTRQETIARAQDLTLRVEVTTCTGYRTGSGFLVGPRLIATAAHVLNGAQTVALRGSHDESLGTVIGTDQERDVALIRAKEDVGVGNPLAFADKEPEQGDEIVTIGYPEGRPQTPTTGTVSRLGQSVDVDKRRLHGMVQFDADVSPGSSGGPLLDLHGEVIGLTDTQDDYTVGANYAVSSKTAQPLIAAWTDSPAEVTASRCPDRSTAVSDRSDSADGAGIAYGMRAYFDSLNTASKLRHTGPDESLGYYEEAYDSVSGRLLKHFGTFDDFRQDRLDVRYAKVRVVAVHRVDEVTDNAEVNYTRTVFENGKSRCTYYHYRYQMRLASGSWKLDDRVALSDSSTRC